MKNTQHKAEIAVAQAIATFTKLGYGVALPLTESAAYDILLDDGLKIYRLQVRYSKERDVELRKIRSNASGYIVKKVKAQSYDWLYIFRPTGEEYLIKKCLINRRAIRPLEKHRINSTVKHEA